jgi:hypothetical protein
LLVLATAFVVLAGGRDARATAETSDATLVLKGSVDDIDVDGGLVTTVEIAGEISLVGTPVTWLPSTGRVSRFAPGSPGDGCESASPVVRSGGVVTFECGSYSNSGEQLSIYLSSKGAKRATEVSYGWNDQRASYNLTGDAGIIAFNRGRAAEVWLVRRTAVGATTCPGTRVRRCRRIASGISLMGVVDGNLVGWARDGGLAFLSPRGGIVRRLAIPRAGAVAGAGQVGRDVLYVERRGTVMGYSLADGRVLGSWRMFSPGRLRHFVGVASGTAAYILRERLYVVHLRDGRRRVVPLPPGGFVVTAKLGEDGLAYAYGRSLAPDQFEPNYRLVWKTTAQIMQMFTR